MTTNRVEGQGNWPIESAWYWLGNGLYRMFDSCPWWDECHADGWRGFLT